MLLLIDVGNTNIKLAIGNSEKIINKFYISSRKDITSDELYFEFKKFINFDEINGVSISSVIPAITSKLVEMIEKNTRFMPCVLQPGKKTKVKVKSDNPKEVGADLIAGCIGASVKYKETCLIIDLGTATKYLYMKDNAFVGASISPGIGISLKALSDNGALLPDVSLELPKKVLGTNTIDCIQSGIIYPTIDSIIGMIDRIRKEVSDPNLLVIVTGGFAELIYGYLPSEVILDTDLVLTGLIKLYEYNN